MQAVGAGAMGSGLNRDTSRQKANMAEQSEMMAFKGPLSHLGIEELR